MQVGILYIFYQNYVIQAGCNCAIPRKTQVCDLFFKRVVLSLQCVVWLLVLLNYMWCENSGILLSEDLWSLICLVDRMSVYAQDGDAVEGEDDEDTVVENEDGTDDAEQAVTETEKVKPHCSCKLIQQGSY